MRPSQPNRLLDTNGHLSLAAGASFNWGGPTLTIPADVPPGNYYIGILVDTGGTIAESNETNNSASVPLSVVAPPKPDLRMGSIGRVVIKPDTIEPGGSVTISGELTAGNVGGASSGTFLIGAYLVDPLNFRARYNLDGGVGVKNWIAGQSVTSSQLSCSVTVPRTISLGRYSLYVMLDIDGVVDETDETNNTAAIGSLTVIKPEPDLSISAGPAITPSSVLPGGSIQLSYTIQNSGPAGAGSFTYGIHLSDDAAITIGDRNLYSATIVSLASGGSLMSPRSP